MQREITHIQYTSWPDHGVPDDASDFLELVRKVRNVRSTSVEPVIVHCRYVFEMSFLVCLNLNCL